MNKAKKVNLVRGIICRTVLVIFLAFTLLPAWVMIVNSFKTPNQLLDGVLWFAFPLNFGNYAEAFNKIAPYIWNSVSISVVSTVGITLIAALTGYAFGHFEFKGKNILFAFIMVNMMIPSVLTLVPSYLVVVTLGLYDTQFAVLLPYLGGGAVMGIYLVRGFVEQLPKAVFEAAKIDGASEFKTFVFIAMPLLGTILTTVSILALLNAWNDIVWPMLVLDSDRLKTIPLGLIQFNQQQGANKGAMFAGYILTSLPLLLYFVLNLKSFMDSLTEGAVK